MDFEKAARAEKSVRLILESVAEQLADDVDSEVKILSQSADSLVFQPFLVPEFGSEQRVGPSKEFVDKFLVAMIDRLESLNPDVNWKDGLKIQVSDESIVTVRVSYGELNS